MKSAPNIRPGLLPPELERQVRLTFNSILYNYVDLFRLPALTAEAVDRLVTVDGWDNVQAALSEDKGIVMNLGASRMVYSF